MHRRGFSLVETLVVMSIGTVVLGIAVSMLHVLMRAERSGRDHAAQTGILARLAEQFREDVHAAVGQTPGPLKDGWKFALPNDRTVVYRTLPGELRREESVAGKPLRQESYVLPDGCTAAIAANKAMPPLIELAVGPKIRIAAVLGRDHRFIKPPGGEK